MNFAYFAMPVTHYNTPELELDISLIRSNGCEPYIPSSAEDDTGYKDHGMQYFLDLIDEKQFITVFFRAFSDRKISSGVVAELDHVFDRGIPVFEIFNNHIVHTIKSDIMFRLLNREQTRQRIKFLSANSYLDGLGNLRWSQLTNLTPLTQS